MIKRALVILVIIQMLCVSPLDAAQRVKKIIVQQQIVVPHIVEQPVLVPVTNLGLNYYYRVTPQGLKQQLASPGLSQADIDSLSDSIAQKVLNGLLEEAGPQDNAQPTPNTPPGQPPVVPPTPKPTLELQVQTIFQNKCAKCHTTDQGTGHFELLDDKGFLVKLERDVKWDVFDDVDLQRMPKNGEPLSVAEIETIREWARLK